MRMRFGIACSLSLGSRAGALGLKGLDLRDRPANFLDPRRTLELVGRGLKTQVELFALQLDQLLVELVVGLGAKVFYLLVLSHHSPPKCEVSPRRATTLVLIGNFIAARLNACAASGPETPSNSNRMRPGLTRAAQYSIAPLPLPWRTSAGFFETGTSGNTRIHSRPWRLMWRVIARRAASICRAVIRSGSRAFSPRSEEHTSELQSRENLVCRLLLEKKKKKIE